MKRILSLIISICLILSAVPVFASDSPYENIAPSAALVPLTVRSTNDHLLVTDGVKDVSKHAEGWQVRKESYIRFDFGEMKSFNHIDIYEINTTKVRRLKGYKIEVSQNTEEWETLAVLDESEYTCSEMRDDKHFKGSIEFEKVTARFVKVTIFKAEDPSGNANKNIGYVEEIEIFDTKPEIEGRVIAGSTHVILPQDVRSEIKPVDYSGIMEKEHQWFLEQQIHMPGSPIDGAFVRNKNHPQKYSTSEKTYYTIEPYFVTLGCLGLLDIPTEETIIAVKKWVDWYIRHINREPDKYGIAGTIYTRNVNCEDYNDYWSTDDYSASDSRGSTFLILLKKLYDVTGDIEFIKERKADIELILDSAIFTMRDDGLTDAKNQEGHYTKYLQDNIQVLMSLKAISELEGAMGDSMKAEHYKALYEKSESAVEGMWLEDKGEYIYYITPNKTRLCDWTVFYGDAASEVFPILYDALPEDSDRAIHLYKRFNSEQPLRVLRPKETDFPWMATAIISGKMEDIKRANEHLSTMEERYMDGGRKWPWYIFESGNSIRAANETKKKTNIAAGKPALVNGSASVISNDLLLNTEIKANDIVIDLGGKTLVNRAVLKGAKAYNLYSSDDGVSYTLIGNSTKDVFDFDKISTKFIKFEIPGGADIREAELYYNPINLFDKKISYASSLNEDAFDGNDNSTVTKWLSNVEEKPWYLVDLGQETEIDEVEILWDYNSYPSSYSVHISDDNINFTEVARAQSKGGNEKVSFPLKKAKYVKIMSEDAEKKSIGIFEIFGYNHSGTQIIKDTDLYKIYVDRVKISFDTDPVNESGRLMVPLRAVCEALDMEVSWNDEERKATAIKDNLNIEMTIGNKEIKVNDTVVNSDVAPNIYNSRTLVPLRALAEATGSYVGWDGNTNTVTVITK